MTTVTINDLPVAQELTAEAAEKTAGGRISMRDVSPEVVVADPSGGAGYWNPYDGNLLNHPEDDG